MSRRSSCKTTVPLPKKAVCPELLYRPTVVGMVGLPARGKSYIAKKLTRYLTWVGVNTRVFNVGQYRRRVATHVSDNSFFRSDNKEAQEIREKCAMMAIEDTVDFLKNGGEVAIVDATNTTTKRRQLLKQHFVTDNHFHLFFVESVCDDPAVIEANILNVKVGGLDYVGQNKDTVVRDFLQRIEHYAQVYEPLGGRGEEDVPYIQIINKGAKFVVNKPVGLLQSRVLFYLMKVRVISRTIYLSPSGESTDEGEEGKLTVQGWKFAEDLAQWLAKENNAGPSAVDSPLQVWSSDSLACLQTAGYISDGAEQRRLEAWPSLRNVRATYQELIARLEPVVMAMEEAAGDIVVVSHQAILQCLLAYLQGRPIEELSFQDIPANTVIKVSPTSYGHSVEFVPLM